MSLDRISKRIKEISQALVTVRTGTIVSNMAELGKTQVILDNDPSRTPVAAQGLNQPLPNGTRVHLLSFPVGGLMVLGPLSETPSPGRIIYTASGSLTAAQVSGFRSLRIRGVGGGGAGGGAVATGAGQLSTGGGGQGGTYGEVRLLVASLVFPLAITVGAGGIAVSGGGGGPGGLSRVRGNNNTGVIYFEVNGGAGGSASTAIANPSAAGGNSAASATADFSFRGHPGGFGKAVSDGSGVGGPMPGYGGASYFSGGEGSANIGAIGNLQGGNGTGYGGGGGGSSRRASQTALAGGSGSSGIVIIDLIP